MICSLFLQGNYRKALKLLDNLSTNNSLSPANRALHLNNMGAVQLLMKRPVAACATFQVN